MGIIGNCDILLNKGKKLRRKRMRYAGKTEILLYATVTKEVAEQIKKDTYRKWIKASEYAELNLEGSTMMEVVLELKYDTRRLLDTVNPEGYKKIEQFIKEEGYKKSEITDEKIVEEALRRERYTGVRMLHIGGEKLYQQTKGVFKDTSLIYCVHPKHVKVMQEKKI